jgi:hypothetical protein
MPGLGGPRWEDAVPGGDGMVLLGPACPYDPESSGVCGGATNPMVS